MKIAVAMLQQWYRDNPARLLQAALSQAERLAQMAPEAEAIRAQNASLQQQLEVKTKRIAQLEAALEEAQRAAHRQAALSVATPKDAPLRPSDRGASADIRALAGQSLSRSMSPSRSNSVLVRTAAARSSRTIMRSILCEVAAMLRAAVALQKQKAELSPQTFSDLRLALQDKAVQLLELPRGEPNEECVRNRLYKQRDHLFTFLDHDGVRGH